MEGTREGQMVLDWTIVDNTNAGWIGAPPPLFCDSTSKYSDLGYWNRQQLCQGDDNSCKDQPFSDQCCSEFGWCGSTEEFRDKDGGTSVGGNRVDGVCGDPNECCSEFGWCGSTAEFCSRPRRGIYAVFHIIPFNDIYVSIQFIIYH